MDANFYLAVMIGLCIITAIVSLVYHLVKAYRELVRNIRIAEIVIIDALKKKLHGDTLDWIVDTVTTNLESALHSK